LKTLLREHGRSAPTTCVRNAIENKSAAEQHVPTIRITMRSSKSLPIRFIAVLSSICIAAVFVALTGISA
jgi:hypothetical protein